MGAQANGPVQCAVALVSSLAWSLGHLGSYV